jgi:DNA-binding NarL/FixJ family response regulator
MSVAEERAGLPMPPSTHEPALIVIAAEAALRHEIDAVLARTELPPLALLKNPEELGHRGLGEETILVFACDVDRPAAITALRRLRRRAATAAIVAVSPQATATAVRRTLDAGADALVFQPEVERALVATIRAVQSGQSVVPRNLRAGVERPYLSHRERQVLTLVCEGMTNAEVAKSLYLAESTIKSHMASIFTKFGVHSRKEAVAVFGDLNLALANLKAGAERADGTAGAGA